MRSSLRWTKGTNTQTQTQSHTRTNWDNPSPSLLAGISNSRGAPVTTSTHPNYLTSPPLSQSLSLTLSQSVYLSLFLLVMILLSWHNPKWDIVMKVIQPHLGPHQRTKARLFVLVAERAKNGMTYVPWLFDYNSCETLSRARVLSTKSIYCLYPTNQNKHCQSNWHGPWSHANSWTRKSPSIHGRSLQCSSQEVDDKRTTKMEQEICERSMGRKNGAIAVGVL